MAYNDGFFIVGAILLGALHRRCGSRTRSSPRVAAAAALI
jgi:hypothetical protein